MLKQKTESPPKAIWHQQVNALQEEMKMISACAIREIELKLLRGIINDINEKRLNLDDEITLSLTLQKFISVRESTIDLLISISNWQSCFIKIKRPQLMETDYLVKMIETIDFVNTCMIRRKFNFQIGTGNLFILPRNAPRTIFPVIVSKTLAGLISEFSNPNEERLRVAYEVLLVSLPPKVFCKIFSLADWMLNCWYPMLEIRPETIPLQVESVSIYGSPLKSLSAPSCVSSINSDSKSPIKLSIRKPKTLLDERVEDQNSRVTVQHHESQLKLNPKLPEIFSPSKKKTAVFVSPKRDTIIKLPFSVEDRVGKMSITTEILRDFFVNNE